MNIDDYMKMNPVTRFVNDTVETVKKSVNRTLDWIIKNPEKAALLASGACLISKGIKGCVKGHQRSLKNRTIYDHSLHCHHEMTRPLRPDEKVMIQQRRQNGEKLVEILNDMRVLRK